MLVLWLVAGGASAQVIGGNVYGGGNQGNVGGSATVQVLAGDIDKVFGGARMANVGGNTYVNIDGEHSNGYTVTNYVYGGNDIAGTIGTAEAVDETLPLELAGNEDGVDITWNTYVHLSTKTASEAVYYTQEEIDAAAEGDDAYGKTTSDIKAPAVVPDKTYIGQLFAGGNGDYTYFEDDGVTPLTDTDGNYVVKKDATVIATSDTPFSTPELAKAYLDIQGGSIVYAYGGGNKATVTEETVIHMDNPSEVVNSIIDAANPNADPSTGELLTNSRFKDGMGINMGYSHPSSGAFQIGRLFGGNNLAEMSIMPRWNLQGGLVRNLYSGGNKGAMTSPKGLLLEIPATSSIVVDNLYGGCRMADVEPEVGGQYTPTKNEDLGGSYKFPDELAARVLVRGGDINNVYGGNDITGRVYGGNAVGIYTSIRGDVYGGGNGAYPYTDNPSLIGNDTYGDLYYAPGSSSVAALNAFRPNAEQVSIRLAGTSAADPTIIGGSVYVGGNCATLKPVKPNPLIELKIGSHVIADKVFLGNNGEGMVTYNEEQKDAATDEITLREGVLRTLQSTVDGQKVSQMDLTDEDEFATYMEGVAMDRLPNIVFDQTHKDPATYTEYSSYIGSLFCGGNRGSMTYGGTNTMKLDHKLIVYDKFVGGCNNANVAATAYNAAYEGGIRGTAAERLAGGFMADGKIKDRLILNFNGLKIQPKRLYSTQYVAVASGATLTAGDTYYTSDAGDGEFEATGSEDAADGTNWYIEEKTRLSALEWNTAKWKTASNGFVEIGIGSSSDDADDADRRLLGGNIYGGCYSSGHVNGNVVININQDIIERYGDEGVFADADATDGSKIASGGDRRSGVLLDSQADDVMSVAMTVFGGGCGEDTEIWGSTTVNHNNGYCFQIFGGGEEGVVGKKGTSGDYAYDAAYSTTVNLNGSNAGYSEDEDGDPLAETEYIYGGGNEGDVCGDSYVNLGNGRIYDAFGGASNADILGATEVYIGRQPNSSGGYKDGFPWIRDNVYGGNDFGGTVKGTLARSSTDVGRTPFDTSLLESSTYVKYIQGRVDSIFGGCYGYYNYPDRIFQDYTNADGSPKPGFHHPHIDNNSFVHFQPIENDKNKVGFVFGGSEGVPGQVGMNNFMQEESYVLIDDVNSTDDSRFALTDIYGGGAYAGMGKSFMEGLGSGRTVVDLFAGRFNNIYGGSNKEGLIGYTRVNVPAASTAKVNAIFGGGKGYDDASVAAAPALAARPCDTYVTCVDFQGTDAIVGDAIYGGNHNRRIAFDTYLNISVPVISNKEKGYQATVYGAGYGEETVSGRTNVYMNSGSNAYKVFGGGRDGNVYNFESLKYWLGLQYAKEGDTDPSVLVGKVKTYGGYLVGFKSYISSTNPVELPSPMPAYNDNMFRNDAGAGEEVNLVDTKEYHNTNVHLMQGSNVTGYAYGGGFGENAVVAGTTYIELKGGNVDKDIYGGGQGGPVMDEYGFANDGVTDSKDFTATTNVVIEGGMVRNVYGGGYLGDVGKHTGDISTSYTSDIPAVANVTIGKTDGTSFLEGIPAIMRNAYGGGEGGSVYGTANITLNNGYIGYRYKNNTYVEELEDSGYSTPNTMLADAGNIFGGGYVVNSFVDIANVNMFGGIVRGSLYGGGELGPIGAGSTKTSYSTGTGKVSGDVRIFRAGKANVKLYDGHVKRNVFGGGRGQDSWGGDGTKFMDEDVVADLKANGLFCKGYVFGQTEVDVYGGEIGTAEGVARGYGNVFGGGDIGYVYSAYEHDGELCIGKKNGVRYDDTDNSEGYYYEYEDGAFNSDGGEYILTEDCKVLVEPWLKANSAVTVGDKSFAAGEYVPTSYLNYLGNKTASAAEWDALSTGPTKAEQDQDGILIHNAVFAGGNTSPGSNIVSAATTTVYGNATASVHDAFHRDFVTVGQGRTGGIYGDGNLTLVDGYRELNISNYGTDYYSIQSEITKETYDNLPDREAAYYEIRYRCLTTCKDKDGKTYTPGSTISADELLAAFNGVTVAPRTVTGYDADGNPISEEVSGGTPVSILGDNGIPLEAYWIVKSVRCYAGRPMNTIQRADFCGVFGSRMVMMGAQDRVPAIVDYTNYTINRVREVSLNKKQSVRSTDLSIGETSSEYYRQRIHGNYFGIYSVVNFLGALTSDVDFSDVRRTDSDNEANTADLDPAGATITATSAALAELAAHPIAGVTVSGSTVTASTVEALYKLRSVSGVEVTGTPLTNQTYYQWKAIHHEEKNRNNGTSYNKVALASGVYLELTTEKSTGDGLYEKDWGYITGVVELDLISVQQGLGGGFVYAKNEHGVRTPTGLTHTTVTALNDDAVTRKKYSYDTDDANKEEWQTSGNFIHSSQTIIDDCYNIGNRYLGTVESGAMPAHYWYIKGLVYVYDQYISAYTGAANAYSEIVNIPLTISSASHGRMTLLDVMPNYYAYYADTHKTKLTGTGKIVLRDVEYGLNDPISYWDYYMLSADEKKMFVAKTYVTTDSCKIGDNYYPAGYVMLPDDYTALNAAAETKDLTPDDDTDPDVKAVIMATIDADGNSVEELDDEGHAVYKAFTDIFRESNNLSHDTGYILTYKVDNPMQWNDWYTPKSGASLTGKKDTEEIEGLSKDDYEDGPTYTPVTTGLYGQTDYGVGSIISEDIYNTYQDIVADHPGVIPTTTNPDDANYQATFKPAWIVTAATLETTNKYETDQRFYKGATLAKEDYTASAWAAMSGSVAEAYVVTSTIQLNATDYIYRGTYMTATDKAKFITDYPDLAADINKYIVPAYYCTDAGKYGGDYFETGHNYRGLAAFSSMSEADRSNFKFNYDALDLLIDPTYSRAEGYKYQYDGASYDDEDDVKDPVTGNKAQYSLKTPIDYEATFKGTSLSYKYNGASKTISTNVVILRDEYESLLNERYYYTPINVTQVTVGGTGSDSSDPYPYYVIKNSMFVGDTPYAPGQLIDKATYEGLSNESKRNITTLYFAAGDEGKTFYYCREGYTIAPQDDGGKPVVNVMNNSSYTYGETVPVGVVIDATNFEGLTNNQANFVIHGLAPTETSTLYVTRNSDIKDLSTERIITVVYQYDYVETDLGGMNIVPVSERHVLNIHLQFKSGVPTVEDIQKPDIILPGTTISIKEPFVTPGAYEVTGGGWELFDDEKDAESHINGIEYSPNIDPLYLYQNKYLVAYYAKTYLGKTYSNAVPVTVANYHDLKKVMDATTHHYYIDHKDIFNVLKVEPKIYINDYSTGDPATSQNGLDLFKNLYDLSVLDASAVETDPETGLINDGTIFDGHKPLNSRVAAGNKLEFFLRTDIDHTGSSWTPIASTAGSDPCFKGTFHGDGHTLSGLDNSLFGKLCGKVYNLGVTGSFSSAGVADYGDGYVENCWVNTSALSVDDVYAVFGEPSRGTDEEPIQIVNSYCQEGKTYKTTPVTHGVATPKPDRAFYNGEVAYDLNGFYLYKRYCDKQVSSGATDQGYQYYTIDAATDKPVLQSVKYYASNPDYCSSGFRPATLPEGYAAPMYVEDRFADGDFRYAAGTIPTTDDERLFVDTENDNEEYFFPIWPDDYIFFGQMLTYGHGMKAHQAVPTAVARDDGRLSQTEDANRVYRAPAYFSNSTMSVAHFNPNAFLAQKSADGTREAYPRMTAIDFKGHNDTNWGIGTVSGSYAAGKAFYPPLLDDDGLLSIKNCDETRNLLVYAPEQAENVKTYNVLTSYFAEPDYADYYSDPTGYRLVGEAPTSAIYGHLVQNETHLTATSDHLLVDKQDFNCPISYDFGAGKRMWYQRRPDSYVDMTTGWEAVSLPFTAELVTTQQKGEITHFYGGSQASSDGTKIGHEYWLREFKGINAEGDPEVAVANFTYPDATSSREDDKAVTNRFLWDYYYSQSYRQDANTDLYQQYYKDNRTYEKYPKLATATPYLIGFPGDTYYEFDLSGSFVPENTYSAISALEKQVITFASNPDITIGVSDEETAGVQKALAGSKDYAFAFKPNYLTTTLSTTDGYTLNAAGDGYEQVATTATVLPFRPYFTATASSHVKEYKNKVRSIVFTREPSQMYEHDEDDISNTGELIIKSKQGRIVVTSTLQEAEDVVIVNVGGAVVDRYTIQPGETRETPIHVSGVYLVNRKKLSVRIK